VCSGNGKNKSNGDGFDNAGEDAVKVNSKLLRIAISDETSLEFFNRSIGFAFDSKDEVAMHQIGARRRHVSLRNAGPRS
jgi:hypothetical protein